MRLITRIFNLSLFVTTFGIMSVAAQGTASITIENNLCVITYTASDGEKYERRGGYATDVEDCEYSRQSFLLNDAKMIEKEIAHFNKIKAQQKAEEKALQAQRQKSKAISAANIEKQTVESAASDNNPSTVSKLDAFLSNSDNLVVLSYIAIGAFTLLFFLGFTNSIIVYRDVTEFIWSLAIIIVPIATFMALMLLGPEETPPGYNIFWTTSQEKIVTSIGILFSLLAVAKTFSSCLANNGIILGPIMFLFKLAASVISIIVVIGVVNKLFEQNRSIKNVMLAMILFGVFSFFLKRLINGERVMFNLQNKIS